MPFIGNKPSAVPLTSADITDNIIVNADINSAAAIAYSKLSLGTSIVNADIANSTINLTTKVTGTLPVANGGTGLAALGTSLQVLRTNTGATALEFATPSSGSFTFLGETSASNVASVSLNGYFTSDYDIYKIFVDGVYGSVDASFMRMRFRISGSDDTSSNYYSVVSGYRWDGNQGDEYETATSSFRLNPYWSGTAQHVSNYEIALFNPLSTSSNYNKGYVSTSFGGNTSYGNANVGAGCFRGSLTSALSGITLFPGSGNIYARKIRLYGIKNS